MDSYDLLAQHYPGWTLTDIRSLSFRERMVWLSKAAMKPKAVR
jgi:hypothetical protein